MNSKPAHQQESPLARMRRVLIAKHGWEAADFQGMTFGDIEAEFLDVEPDFRPSE